MDLFRAPPEPLRYLASGEALYRCPLPDCPDRSGHMQLNEARGVWFCHRCQRGGTIAWLRQKTGIAWPCDPAAAQRSDTDREVLAGILAELFGQRATPRQQDRIDFSALGDEPLCFSKAQATAGGLGDVRWLLPLYGPGMATWWTGPAQVAPLPPPPWSVAVRAVRYLVRRGWSVGEAERWGLVAPCDPELRRREFGRTSRYGRVVLPAWDPGTGYLCDYQARAVGDDRPRYLGPPRPTTGPGLLWSPRAYCLASGHALHCPVLVEGPMDAAALDRVGLPGVAICGLRLRPGALDALRLAGAREAVVLLDATAHRDALSLAAELAAGGVPARVARLGQGDPDEAGADAVRAAVQAARAPSLLDVLPGGGAAFH